MKGKKLRTAVVIFCLAVVVVFLWYTSPKTFLRGVDPAEVEVINIFDGNTGRGWSVEDPEEIAAIVANVQEHTLHRKGISLGYMGYSLKMSFVDENEKEIALFILNGEGVIRKDPFFYRCDGGLCYEEIKATEGIIQE